MKSRFYSLCSLSTMLALLSLIAGCSSGGDDSASNDGEMNSMTLTGRYVSSAQPSAPFKASQSSVTLTHAYAIALYDDRIGMDDAIEVNISEDGSFAIEVAPEYDWVLLQQFSNGRTSLLSIPVVDSNESLLSAPTSKISSTTFDYGDVESSATDGESESSQNSHDVANLTSYSLEDLTILAKNDDYLKAIRNLFRYNIGKDANHSVGEEISMVSVNSVALNGDSFVRSDVFRGYQIDLYFGSALKVAKSYEKICSNEANLTVVPPGAIGTSTTTFTPEAPFGGFMHRDVNPEQGCTSSDGFMTLSADGGIGLFFGETTEQLAQSVPIAKGDFNVLLDGEQMAFFDLAYGVPVTADKHLKAIIPSVKLNLDDNQSVTDISVQWSSYDENSKSYQAVDKSLLPELLKNNYVGVALVDESSEAPYLADGTPTCTFDDTFSTISCAFNEKSYYHPDLNVSARDVSLVSISYKHGALNYRFNFYVNPF